LPIPDTPFPHKNKRDAVVSWTEIGTL
jgi:hypothetical protein